MDLETKSTTPDRISAALQRIAEVCRIAELTRAERRQVDMDLNLLSQRFKTKPETKTQSENSTQ